ncbi:putative 3-hydroxyisobutyrate dehydrogenase-like 3, mitochondrial [Apium graveolens]|uniref:putative 3-hydroxyisobutyrate dehydrogenase-like 3, mitochondrial n=1 Tax=Apium graveolens TaxID=4045 RepID=UPI003D79ACB0
MNIPPQCFIAASAMNHCVRLYTRLHQHFIWFYFERTGFCAILLDYYSNPSKALQLQSQGARIADSISDLAKTSDVIFTIVGHPSDVRQIVLENSTGLLPHLNPKTVLIDHTSSHPLLAKEICDAVKEKNCYFIDAPISGGDIGAREGRLAIFAGGEDSVVEWLSPLFEVMGRVTYMGCRGNGQSCKIANQIVVGGNLLGLSEGLVFAEYSGVGNTVRLN